MCRTLLALAFELLLVVSLSCRYVAVGMLSTVSTRDIRTLNTVRKVLKLLCADPARARLVLTRDRSALVPGASRRRSRRYR